MTQIDRDSRTYGEKLVEELFNKMSKKRFRSFPEPRIITGDKNSKPDFILVDVKSGVIVVEVKDWVELVRMNRRTVTIRRRNGQEVQERNPFDIAEGYCFDLVRQFEKHSELMHEFRGRRKLLFPWQPLVIIPNIDDDIIAEFERHEIMQKGCFWGKQKANSSLQKLEKLIEDLPWKFRLSHPLTEKTFETILMTIDPEINLVYGEAGQIVGGLTRQQYSTAIEQPKQLRLPLPTTDILSEKLKDVSEDVNVRLVRGVAGSGKTLVLARRAAYLAKAHPELRVLVMTFNKNLMLDLQRRITSANIEVINFHKMCSTIIGSPDWHEPNESAEGWLRANHHELIEADKWDEGFVAEEIAWRKDMDIVRNSVYLKAQRRGRGSALSQAKRRRINYYCGLYIDYQNSRRQAQRNWMDWSDVPCVAVEHLKRSGHPKRHNYDVVMIDEAQDFAPTWLEVVRLLLRPGGELFICDDPTQSIFRNYSWREKGVEVVGRTRILNTPFRCTRQISQAAHSLIQADQNMSQSDDIVRPLLESKELTDGDPVQLIRCGTPEAEQQDIWRSVEKMVSGGTDPRSIAVLCHSKRIVKKWAGLRDRGVFVSDFRTMKGLEFEVVFIPHLDNAFTDVRDENSLSHKRRNIFTAMTRARYTLIMSYHRQIPEGLLPVVEHVQQLNLS